MDKENDNIDILMQVVGAFDWMTPTYLLLAGFNTVAYEGDYLNCLLEKDILKAQRIPAHVWWHSGGYYCVLIQEQREERSMNNIASSPSLTIIPAPAFQQAVYNLSIIVAGWIADVAVDACDAYKVVWDATFQKSKP